MSELLTIEIRTSRRMEMVDITREVADAVAGAGAASGLAHVYCPHTTGAIAINENADPSVKRDVLAVLADRIPHEGDYHHAEGNSDAHIKSVLTGPGQIVPVAEGRPVLGTWQGIFFCEFDGPRARRVLVKVIEG